MTPADGCVQRITPAQVCRDGETRTPDPLLPKQVRYQLRHIPDVQHVTGADLQGAVDCGRGMTVVETVSV